MTVILCVVGISPTYAFDIPDDGMAQMNRALRGTVVSDLMVGDRMRISEFSFCVSKGILMVTGDATASKRYDFAPEIVVEIISGGSARVTISNSHIKEPTRSSMSFSLRNCAFSAINLLVPVASINGFTTLEDYLNSDMVTGLPMSSD